MISNTLQGRCAPAANKEVTIMKEIFGIPMGEDEEVCEDTLHELGCGCEECEAHKHDSE